MIIKVLVWTSAALWVLWMTVGWPLYFDWLTKRGIVYYERTGRQPWWWPE